MDRHPWKLEEAGRKPTPALQRFQRQPTPHLPTPSPQNPARAHFHGFKPHTSWDFVSTAPENQSSPQPPMSPETSSKSSAWPVGAQQGGGRNTSLGSHVSLQVQRPRTPTKEVLCLSHQACPFQGPMCGDAPHGKRPHPRQPWGHCSGQGGQRPSCPASQETRRRAAQVTPANPCILFSQTHSEQPFLR